MFDTVRAGHHCGQVKMWRNGLDDILIGDTVEFLRQKNDRYADEYWSDPDWEPPLTYTVEMDGTGWLVVADGVLVDWADDPGEGQRLQRPQPRDESDVYKQDLLPGDCDVCEAVRSGSPPRPPREWRNVTESFAVRRERDVAAAAQQRPSDEAFLNGLASLHEPGSGEHV